MKRLAVLMLTGMMALNIVGCAKAEIGSENQHQQSADISNTLYMGDKGWSVMYDEAFFNMNELEAGKDIELIYKEETNGSAYVELSQVEDKKSKDLIEEKRAEYEKTSQIYEVNDEKKSGYVFYVPDITATSSKGNDRYTSVEVLDIKDGALVITASQALADEDAVVDKVADRIADVINSIEL